VLKKNSDLDCDQMKAAAGELSAEGSSRSSGTTPSRTILCDYRVAIRLSIRRPPAPTGFLWFNSPPLS
jgi:hypothetical protein